MNYAESANGGYDFTLSEYDGEEDYENAADQYFAGWQESETWLGWQDMNDLGNNAEEIAAQLDQSLNVFLY